MAKIKAIPFLRHVRVDPSQHVIHYSRGTIKRSGRGLAFWFFPLSASVVQIPCDDRDVPFLFHTRSEDFQDIVVQGFVTYRVENAERLASRVDFTIDTKTGQHVEHPLERLAVLLTQLAQRIGGEYVATTPVREVLSRGVAELRRRLHATLFAHASLQAMGLEVVDANVTAVSPTSELEKALQAPTRESIQQRSDEAMFQRRAMAVEKERAISENELQNRIELSRREEDLIAQEGVNEQRKAREATEAQSIVVRADVANDRLRAETEADVTRLATGAEAEGITAVQGAHVDAERLRMDIFRDLPPHVLVGLAAQEFAGKLQRIERIQIAPDGIGPFLSDLAQAGARLLDARASGVATAEEN